MTREEAIKTLKENLCNICSYHGKNMESCDIAYCDNRAAIRTLEQETCEDAVSREAILKEIPRLWNSSGDKDYCMETLRDFVVELLPVTPKGVTVTDFADKCRECGKQKNGKWIPVSERLPEESLNSVIGWDTYRERCVFVQYIDGYFQITGRDDCFDIVAWMPLPKAYKEEKENE